jgi:hypothetical protein
LRCIYPYVKAASSEVAFLYEQVLYIFSFEKLTFHKKLVVLQPQYTATQWQCLNYAQPMTVNNTPCRNEQELIERYGAIALEKQTAFYQIIGGQSWHINIEGSHIIFGNHLVCPIQVIGTYIFDSQAWLYAWTNSVGNFPETVLSHARQLKEYGDRYQNDFLRYHGFQATEADLHKIGMIASGMFQATGYFIANLGNTALLLTVYNSKLPNTIKEDLGAIPDIFPAICNLFPMNQRRAFVEYLAAKGIEYTEQGNVVKATKNEASIVGSFDEKGHMTKLEAIA